MDPVERALQLLAAAGKDDSILPPTTLFNEGWLLRLVLDWYVRRGPGDGLVRFATGSRWHSEVLLPSRFFRSAKREGWTHADAIIGHFDLGGHLKTGQSWTGQNRPVGKPPHA